MMSESRFTQVIAGMTAVAKKVYEAVPSSDQWSHQQIVTEVKRLGYGIDHHTIKGCINSLIQAGLVQETAKGMFRRQPVRPKTETTNEEMAATQEIQPVKAADRAAHKEAIDILGGIADKLRNLSKATQSLADEVDKAGLDISDQIAMKEAGADKLKQLKDLLKELA